MKILGISAFYHDSAAALLVDGEAVAAAQEERFTRKKHDFSFPANAAAYCLQEAGITAAELDYVCFYDKPLLKFERLIETYLAYAPRGIVSFLKAMSLWLTEKLHIPEIIARELGYEGHVLFSEHHESHAASAFFPSPFQEAAVVTIDGVGEWTTTSYGVGRGNRVELLSDIHFPHSLGLLYSAFTYFTGFRVNSGEYKLMGLAPYGEPRYVDLILKELIDVKEDGSFRLNMAYFDYCAGLTMTNARFARLFGGPPRKPEETITQREMDLARSVQIVTEEVMLRMVRHVHRETGLPNLCLAGGVALNCVGNGRILRESPFRDLWIQPAAGDAGGALGAAYVAWHHFLGRAREVSAPGRDAQKGTLLGPAFSDEAVGRFLAEQGIPARRLDPDALADEVSQLIAEEKVVGWFQGRMEFGPRALGSRSILGDARSREMQRVMNLKIKFRESFRPFAPSVLRDACADYFQMDYDSPYMLLVAPIQPERRVPVTDQQAYRGLDKLKVIRSEIPAVTHVDESARIQTVDRERFPEYSRLLEAFYRRTGCPVIINTSFNVRGEPIVCRPQEAYQCFMRTNIDYLVLGSFLLDKREQPAWEETSDWRKEFVPD